MKSGNLNYLEPSGPIQASNETKEEEEEEEEEERLAVSWHPCVYVISNKFPHLPALLRSQVNVVKVFVTIPNIAHI